jgi:hypothetical protein
MLRRGPPIFGRPRLFRTFAFRPQRALSALPTLIRIAIASACARPLEAQSALDALGPAFLYFGSWWILGAIAFWFIGFETKGRTFEEMDSTLAKSAASPQRVPAA